ncbi:MAG: hypothetical protein HYV63_32035 [Candidatus Schekmanbacteria bacterium]|nr:hypothetical protein [Candidatus Schekmanbacteria bacterium]
MSESPGSSPWDDPERLIVEETLAELARAPLALAMVQGSISRLTALRSLMDQCPSLYLESTLVASRRSVDTLIDHMIRVGPLATELDLPLKASLARDFVLAKAQVLREARLAVEGLDPPCDPALADRLRLEAAQSVHTLLAEELLTRILLDGGVAEAAKRRAATWLIHFWDDSPRVEVGDFCPLLEAAWKARNAVIVDFGTLMGNVEVLRLLAAASDDRFIDAFIGETSNPESYLAFDEFLFGLTFEQLRLLRSRMAEQRRAAVDRQWVSGVLGVSAEDLFAPIGSPRLMFREYRRRQMAATLRRIQGTPGPHRTAETILLLFLLERP